NADRQDERCRRRARGQAGRRADAVGSARVPGAQQVLKSSIHNDACAVGPRWAARCGVLRPCLAVAHRTPTTKAIMNRALDKGALARADAAVSGGALTCFLLACELRRGPVQDLDDARQPLLLGA